jgi:hypothetical protein
MEVIIKQRNLMLRDLARLLDGDNDLLDAAEKIVNDRFATMIFAGGGPIF